MRTRLTCKAGPARLGAAAFTATFLLLTRALAQPPSAPEEPALPVAIPMADTEDGPTVTYSGFQVSKDGSARLSVHMTGAPRVEAKGAGKEAEYILHGVSIPVRNNQNPLLTRHFASVVTSIRFVAAAAPGGKGGGKKAKVVQGDTRLVIEMREAITPSHRLSKAADGTAVLIVDFPKPTETPPEEPDPTPPPVKPAE